MEGAEQDKSEQATPFKLQRARRKGSVARGVDLGFLVSLAAFILYIWIAGDDLGAALSRASRDAIVTAPYVVGGSGELFALTDHVFGAMVRPLAFFGLTVFAAVLLFELLQTGIVFSAEPLKPDFSRLSPAKGLKRVFSMKMLIETAKNILKFGVYVAIAWLVLRSELRSVSATVGDAGGLAQALFGAGMRLICWFALAALFFAGADQLIVRKEFGKTMRMSRRELRREVRDREGDARLKQKRKQLHGEFAAASASLRNVAGADVVVINPTHYAVALRYEADAMAAPAVVSRGANALALRIKALAFRYGVVTVEDKALARALYHGCALDAPVPEGVYRQVADLYLGLRPRAAAPVEASA
jgi:flagellar biosynthetic protein FlhB